MTTDPLEVLRMPILPVDPRPEFAAALLREVEGQIQPVAHPVPTVRYFVRDVALAVEFYKRYLGFEVEFGPTPAFAMLYLGDLRLLLNLPVGAHVLPNGTAPEPGGWNRILLQVPDLPAAVEALRSQGLHFLNDIVSSTGTRQILLEDPSGNPIELFEAMEGYHERPRTTVTRRNT
jgi:catechol 2,3-dioxygenase-like lactoylglutathione lyase family enzyme